jgi:hypothetical protein
MPRHLDCLDQELPSSQRLRKTERLRHRTDSPAPRPNRARDRPTDPLAVLLSHAKPFEELSAAGRAAYPLRPNLRILPHLAFHCPERSDLLAAPRCADALLALSAHRRDWLRPLDEWRVIERWTGAGGPGCAPGLLG